MPVKEENMERIWWREKGQKAWKDGYIIEYLADKVRIGPHLWACESACLWYDKKDLEIEKRS